MFTWIPPKTVLAALAVFVATTLLNVTAAPLNGERFTYTQPNGEQFAVRLWGDEFFAYQETEDGYLIVRDPRSGFFCYAKVLPDGSDFVSTGVRVGKAKPPGLVPKQRLARGKAFEKSLARRAELGFDAKGRYLQPLPQAKRGPASDRGNAVPPPDDGDAQSSTLYAPPPTTSYAPGTGVASGASQPAINSTLGTRVGLVLLASFPDAQGEVTKTQTQINNYFNADTYTAEGNACSIKKYFQIQSGGQLTHTNVVTAWFVAANNKAYYTDENATGRAEQLIKEGLTILANNNFDFTQCDANGDGQIDGLSLLYAGATVNSWSKGLWPGASALTWDTFLSKGLTSNVARFQISDMPASLGIGTVCHELGHMICGFPDLYNYDGNAAQVWKYSLMGSGDKYHPENIDGYLKFKAGWVTSTDVKLPGQSNHTLNVDGGNIVRFINPNDSKEYFVFEMRGNTGYEGPYGGATTSTNPSTGLAIYHVKEDGANSVSTIFTEDSPNCDYSKPFELLVIEDNPSPATIPWYDDPTIDTDDSFDTGDVINDTSTPDLAFWSSRGRTIAAGIRINNIQVNTSNLTFTIENANPPPITASPSVVQVGSNTTLSIQTSGTWTYAWTKVSGPGNVTFGTPSAATTTASFSAAGNYIIRQTLSDGVNPLVSEITVTVIGGVNDYLGIYKRLPVENGYHTGWIEYASSQLQWRNQAGAKWNLSTTATTDLLLTGSTPYGSALEFRFVRQNGQLTSFTFNGETYYRCNPIGSDQSLATPKGVGVAATLSASVADNPSASLTYTVVTPPANGTLSGTAPNLTYTPNTNFTGGDCFTFKAFDGTYYSTVATVSIHVYAPSDAPKYGLFVINGSGDGQHQVGAQVTITADAAPAGKEFDQWLGDVSALADPTSASTTVTMPAANVVVKPSYKSMEFLNEYVGYYVRVNPSNGYHYVWIEWVGDQLKWRNQAGATWNLFQGAQTDVLMTDPTSSYPNSPVTFSRVSGRISQLVFLGETYVRQSPVAVGASLITTPGVAVAATLTAVDPQGNPMTYTVVTQPAHGTLSGTKPNLTYTPNTGYLGIDSFTFKASDASSDSNVAKITITVRTNTAPIVNAGADQEAALVAGTGGGNPVSGAYFEWDAAKDTTIDDRWASSTANTYNWLFLTGTPSPAVANDSRFTALTKAYVFSDAKSQSQASLDTSLNENTSATWEFVLDTDADDGLIMESGGTTDGFQFWIASGALKGSVRNGGKNATVSYTLSTNDKARFIHVVYVIDMAADLFKLYVDGVEQASVAWTGTDWCGSDNAGLGRFGGAAPAGSVADFSGRMALIRYYQNKAFTPSEVTTNFSALTLGTAAVVNLNGSATDNDAGDVLTAAWSIVSGDSSKVSIAAAASPVTTATFTAEGVYTLRLTATDAFGLVRTDDCVITITSALDHFEISGVGSSATVGTPITGITLTAKDASNNTVTGFTGTVSYGGTGGFTGTSSAFTAGVLTGVSLTPVNAGSNLTLTVNDGSGHTGTVTISTILTSFQRWSSQATFSGDTNNDGISNGLAWVLGASGPSVNARSLLPVFDSKSDPSYFIYTYRRSDAAAGDPGTTIAVDYGSTLASWTTAVADGSNIIITPTNDFYAAGVDKVEVKIKKTLAIGNKLFTRLRVTQSP